MPRTKTPRDLTKYRLLPSLDPETYAGLKANIALNGVQVPVVKDEDGYILDGFARAKIAKELGYECPSLTVKGLTEQEKRSQVRALNLARRHLDYATRREIIADELRENPDRSNRWIGKSLGVDHKAVARVRTPMGATGVLPQLSHTLGADGKYRPATRVSLPSNGDGRLAFQRDYIAPDDEEGILRAATEIRQQRNEERTRQQFEKEEAARAKLNGKRTWTLTDDPKVVRCDLLDRRSAVRDHRRAVGARGCRGVQPGVEQAVGGVRGGFRGDLLVPAEALGRQEVVRRVAQGLRVPADARLARQQPVRSQEPQPAQADVVSDLRLSAKRVESQGDHGRQNVVHGVPPA